MGHWLKIILLFSHQFQKINSILAIQPIELIDFLFINIDQHP